METKEKNMPPDEKILYIVRHAKSVRIGGARTDFLRTLTTRGEYEASLLGQWMQRQNLIPDAVICSHAERASQTAVLVSRQLEFDLARITYTRELYLADLGTLCEIIATTPEQAGSLMLIGHNPGLEDLLDFVHNDEHQFSNGKVMPTASLYAVALPSWDINEPHQGRLLTSCRARELSQS